MKQLVRPYIKFSLKENAVYIGLFLFLVGVVVGLATYGATLLANSQQRIQKLETEIRELEKKKTILFSSSGESPQSLTEDVQVMTKLIPEVEDYFSIIYALDKLSQQTGFLVTSYTIDLKNSNASKLALTISGIGNTETFTNFLQNYTFGGERLITNENISLGQKDSGTFGLILNFYNKKANSISDSGLNYQKALVEVSAIKSKVNFSLQEEGVASSEGYPTKPNPF